MPLLLKTGLAWLFDHHISWDGKTELTNHTLNSLLPDRPCPVDMPVRLLMRCSGEVVACPGAIRRAG
jgi:hypothetical protein